MIRLTGATIAVAALSLAFAGTAAAQDKVTELRYTTGAPEQTPWVNPQLRRFEKDVAEASGGKLKISSFIAAQLGNEQDTVQQVARGRIDMGGFSNGAVALLVPELALLGLPFYFKNVAEQDCAVDKMTKTVSDLLAKKGIKFLGWTEVGTGRHRRQEAVPGAGRRQGPEGGVGVEQGVGDDLDHARRQSDADRHHRDRLGLPDRPDRRQRARWSPSTCRRVSPRWRRCCRASSSPMRRASSS